MIYDANCITVRHILENKHDGISKREMSLLEKHIGC